MRLGRKVAGAERVPAGGALGDAEHQGQVERIGAAGQCLVQHAVAADAFDAAAVGLQVEVDVAPADGPAAEDGLLREEDAPVRSVRPGGAAAGKSGPQRLGAEVAEPLAAAGDGDAPAGQVQVIQGMMRMPARRAAWTSARSTISRCPGPVTASPAVPAFFTVR